MITLRLPFADVDGTLSPLVDDAMAHGATADRGVDNLSDDTFHLIFKTKNAADAFKKKLGKDIKVSQFETTDEVVTSDPVDDDTSDAPAE